MEKVINITDVEHIKIFMDQKRQNILQVLKDKKIPMTAKQIAEVLEINPATINFHTNKLCSIGILRVVKTEVIHGIVAKFMEPAASAFRIMVNTADKSVVKLMKNKMSAEAEVLFEKGKQDYIQNCGLSKSLMKRISYTDTYLTLDQLNEFNEMMDKFISDNVTRDNPDKIRFKLFCSYISDDEDSLAQKSCC